ncbi:RES family NAD+ phosphorylase [Verminephrobacter eiseniae]|uniref:RES family NAD+ phosphorylase n=1 Tax=Verminephrobacter eiseniae TaxID=364317 RepID=UPI002238F525|nr:RES family NAD+ phosphorylase [Verminephrobacter eiseniae]
MMLALWRIGSDTPEHQADDMSGRGAETTGGRWNRPGRPVLYCSANIALAALETVVHFNAGALPLNRYLVRMDVPDDIWRARKIATPASLAIGWDATPPGKVSLDAGERWLQSKASALFVVPSVIVPEESNVLIDPDHPDASRITAAKLRRWTYDARIRSS